ncbi:MAG: NAD-dependent epimerase [Bacteroidetes bacterium]|jgi:UDP-glucuronate 4-epimerase|nr:NAD-dependent epimerase [Bacteroidota bacterium]MBT7995257.1 NAD-dependent epimerase [Bacteroidota bacterium]
MSKYIVTGTAGFIGFHTALKLIERGENVVGLDIINDYYDPSLKYGRLNETGIKEEDIKYGKLLKSSKYDNYYFIKLDLEDYGQLCTLFEKEKFEYVIHLAAQAGVRYSLTNPHAYLRSNLHGFLNILEVCRHNQVKHLTYASSSSIYGLNTKMPFSTSDIVDHPISLYAATKKSNELMAHTYSHLYNLPTTGLRFFTVYGPWGRPDMALFIFTKAILENKPIDVFNHGNMLRDFTYIDDIVEGVLRVSIRPAKNNIKWNESDPDISSSKAPYKIYNIGNSRPVKLLHFIKTIEKVTGRKAIIKFKPMQAGDVPATYADITEFIREVNYNPKVKIEEGVSRFIKWYFSYYINSNSLEK